MKYIVLLVIISCCCLSCTTHNKKDAHFTDEQIALLNLDSTSILMTGIDSVKTINLNPYLKQQDFLLDAIVDKVKLLPLETTSESLIADIKKILIKTSYIYVIDYYKGGSVLIFNKEGKFVRRILQGPAPHEINNPNDITFDEDKQELIVYNKYFLSYFTPEGEFVRRERVPLRADEITIIPKGYLFKAYNGQGNQHLGLSQEYLFFVTDRSLELKSVGLPYLLSTDASYGNSMGYLHEGGQTVTVTAEYTDTIYQYNCTTNMLEAKYALDISDKEIPKKSMGKTWNELKNMLLHNDYFLYNGAYLETQKHDLFYIENWYIKLNAIVFRDKASGNMRGGTRMLYNTDIIPPINLPITSFSDYFVSCYLPQNKWDISDNPNFSNEDRQKISNLKEDDNPVLVFFSLKKFQEDYE